MRTFPGAFICDVILYVRKMNHIMEPAALVLIVNGLNTIVSTDYPINALQSHAMRLGILLSGNQPSEAIWLGRCVTVVDQTDFPRGRWIGRPLSFLWTLLKFSFLTINAPSKFRRGALNILVQSIKQEYPPCFFTSWAYSYFCPLFPRGTVFYCWTT